MSRNKFQDRLSKIEKTRAVARNSLQQQPAGDAGEHVEDAVAEPIYFWLHTLFIGVFVIWLLIDFDTAWPYAILGAICYVAFVATHTVWRAFNGSPRRRKEARATIWVAVFDVLLFLYRRSN